MSRVFLGKENSQQIEKQAKIVPVFCKVIIIMGASDKNFFYLFRNFQNTFGFIKKETRPLRFLCNGNSLEILRNFYHFFHQKVNKFCLFSILSMSITHSVFLLET